MKRTTALCTALAAVYGSELDGFIYLFAGPVPASANDALDMDASHTELGKVSIDGDGASALTLDTAASGVITKPTGVDWIAPLVFDGADDSEVTLAPTFGRFCESGDNGRGAATTQKRIQFTISGPTGNGEVIIADTVTRDSGNTGSNTESIDFFRISEPLG